MARLTPEEAAAKWAARGAAASGDWSRGIERTPEAPGAKAAAAADKWQQKLSAPATKEKFKRRVGGVSKEDWVAKSTAATGKYSAGIQGSVGKMQKHQQDVAAHMEAGKRKIAAMPNLTPQDAANRAAAWVLHMAEYKRPA